MKKIIKNISRFLFSLLLIVSIFGTFNVLAETVIFQITKIEVKEKSDKVIVNDVSLSGGQLKNDIVFTEKDDYIKYNITIKNATSDEYTIKSISDDNTSPYLEYTYDDLSNVKLNAGEEKIFELQIKYVQETNNLTISDQAVSLTLTYEKVDGTTGSETITNPDNDNTNPNTTPTDNGEVKGATETITNPDNDNTNPNTTPTDNGEVKGATETITNPKTGDNITTYIILGIISLIGLAITTVSKKHLSKSLMAITVISMVAIPLGVKADSNKYIISFSTNTIKNAYTDIGIGSELKAKIYEITDEYYGSIRTATLEEYNSIKDTLTEENIISAPNSTSPAYIWYDNGEIYYYTTAKFTVVSGDCSEMFSDINITNFDFTQLNTSKVTNMTKMFYHSTSNVKIDLSSFDTSNVTSMESMFEESNISEINLSSFNTSNVTNMDNMFFYGDFKKLDLSSFNTSNITSMAGMFADNRKLEEVNLSSFNTSNVTNLSMMFIDCESLKEIDLSSFDTRNVTEMYWMFNDCTSLKTADLSSFDTSNVTDMEYLFSGCKKLKTIYASDSFVVDNLTYYSSMFYNNVELEGGSGTPFNSSKTGREYARIDDPSNGKPGYFTDIADKPQS